MTKCKHCDFEMQIGDTCHICEIEQEGGKIMVRTDDDDNIIIFWRIGRDYSHEDEQEITAEEFGCRCREQRDNI